jgi:hypothetical protein
MFVFQFVFRIHESDVGLDLGVVVVGGVAVTLGAVNLHIVVERVFEFAMPGFLFFA